MRCKKADKCKFYERGESICETDSYAKERCGVYDDY